MARKLLDEGLQQLPPSPSHFRREFAIAKSRARKSEITVKRIDQNLKRCLTGLRLRALVSGRRVAREEFEFEAILAQRFKQGNKHAE